MTQNIKNLFHKLEDLEPSAELEANILKAIGLERSKELARKLRYARTGLVVSFGALVYSLFVFGKAFLESDFWNLSKLAFSDSGTIVTHFADYTVSLLETLPVLELSAMLVPVLAVMLMLNYYFKFTNNNHYNHIKIHPVK